MGTSSFMDGYMSYFDRLETYLSPEYIKSSTTTAIIIGVLAAALIIFAAVMMKKGLVFGIITGVMQIVGSFCAQKMAHILLRMDFFRVETIYGSSQAELEQKTEQFYDNFFKDAIGDIIPLSICSMLFLASWIFTLIFIVKALNNRPKILPVLALVCQILRYTFIQPYNVYTPILKQMTEQAQKSQDTLYYLITLIPLSMVAVSALLTNLNEKKLAAAAEAPTETTAEATEESVEVTTE